MSGNDFPDDDFYDSDDEPRMSRGKLIMAVLAVLIVAGFGTGIWYAYDQGVKKGVQLAPPIISADTTPVKEKPEDPGGMEIPHQDKQVFGVLKSDGETVVVEKLMQPPEEATDDAPAATAENTTASAATNEGSEEAPKEDLIGKTIEKVEQEAKETTKTVESAVKEAAPATTTEPKAEEKVAVVAPKPAPKPKAKPAATSGTRYRVQLGSFRSSDAAENQWKILNSKFGALLSNVSYRVEDVTVQGKGTFHRLQAGAYDNRTGANKLCDALKAKKQDCLVVSK
ncbi:MAG: SPOR domain-containing protein [Proteobacteria bacterium]|nr:SPOR domain-containing protein [Pseudomonadota bacterium]